MIKAMKMYVYQYEGNFRRLLADELGNYLVWPKTQVPMLHPVKLEKHPNRDNIEKLIDRALNDPNLLQDLWQDKDITELTLKVNDVL